MVSNITTLQPPPVGWTWSPIPWEWYDITKLVLAVVGIVGNGLVMTVLFHHPGCYRRGRRKPRQRHSTDILIAALATADFITSFLIIPQPEIASLPEGTLASELYCRFVHSSFFTWTSICASIFTLTTISVERMIAVRYPFKFRLLLSPGRTASVVCLIWGFSLALNSFNLFIYIPKAASCKQEFGNFRISLGLLVFFVEYLIPVVVMVVAHAFTISALKQQSQSMVSGKGNCRTNNNLLLARRRVVEMLFIVVVCFIACWTPDQVGYLIFNLGVIDRSHTQSVLYSCFFLLAFANSCVNPFIYAARNANFRKAFLGYCSRRSSERDGSQPMFGEGNEASATLQTNVPTASTLELYEISAGNNTSNQA